MNKEKRDKAMCMSFRIEQYAKAQNMVPEEAANRFRQHKMAGRPCELFDALKAQYTAMSAKITQDNLYLFLPIKIGWLAPWLSEDKGISIAETINRIYHSKLYKKLATESTKYCHLGPTTLYYDLKQEFNKQ